MVQRIAPLGGRLYRDAEASDGDRLAHEVVEALGPELALELRLFRQRGAAEDLGGVDGHLLPR